MNWKISFQRAGEKENVIKVCKNVIRVYGFWEVNHIFASYNNKLY